MNRKKKKDIKKSTVEEKKSTVEEKKTPELVADILQECERIADGKIRSVYSLVQLTKQFQKMRGLESPQNDAPL